MPRRFCHSHAAEKTRWVYFMLGHRPRWNSTHLDGMSLLRWHESLLSALSASFFQRATPPFAPSPLFSSQGPSAAVSSGCGRQSVCEKYCCENWVLLHIAHTANRCYSEKNKTQIYPKREHFPLPLITSLRVTQGGLPLKTIQPLATRAEAWQAIPEVSDWVLGIIKRG